MKNKKQHGKLAEDDKISIVRYSAVLLGIHARLVVEGYFLKGGKKWNIFKAGAPICEVIWEDQ